MTNHDSATLHRPTALSGRRGVGWGLLGVLAFSLTVPCTRIAVDGGMHPVVVGCGRAVVAAALAGFALAATGQRRPARRQWVRLAVVAGGVVVGFPVLTSFALTTASATHSAVVIALLPAATAAMAVLRGHERPPQAFWVLAACGAVAAVVFASVQGSDLGGLRWADLLLFGAVLAAAVGYAEGGLLARELGAWQTVSWALVLASPVMLAATLAAGAHQPTAVEAREWVAFAYLAVVSMYLGFFAWYHGLAIGPMTRVSQVQLVQPVLTIAWAALLLGERPGVAVVVGGAAVIVSAGAAVRVRFDAGSGARPDVRGR